MAWSPIFTSCSEPGGTRQDSPGADRFIGSSLLQHRETAFQQIGGIKPRMCVQPRIYLRGHLDKHDDGFVAAVGTSNLSRTVRVIVSCMIVPSRVAADSRSSRNSASSDTFLRATVGALRVTPADTAQR